MTAYLLVDVKAHDLSWAADYAANVPALIRKHGGDYFAVSESVKRYEGEGPDPDQIVLLAFPSTEEAESFLSDPDYAPYKAARLAGTTGSMFGFTPRA